MVRSILGTKAETTKNTKKHNEKHQTLCPFVLFVVNLYCLRNVQDGSDHYTYKEVWTNLRIDRFPNDYRAILKYSSSML